MAWKVLREEGPHFIVHNGTKEIKVARSGISKAKREQWTAMCRGGEVKAKPKKMASGGPAMSTALPVPKQPGMPKTPEYQEALTGAKAAVDSQRTDPRAYLDYLGSLPADPREAFRATGSPEGIEQVLRAAGPFIALQPAYHGTPHVWRRQALPDDQYLYHVTPESNVPAINREGLRPDAPKIAEGGPHGNTRAVFLAEQDTLPTYRDLYGGGDQPVATYRVPRYMLTDLMEDNASEGRSWMSKRPIPASLLEVERGGKWEPLNPEIGARPDPSRVGTGEGAQEFAHGGTVEGDAMTPEHYRIEREEADAFYLRHRDGSPLRVARKGLGKGTEEKIRRFCSGGVVKMSGESGDPAEQVVPGVPEDYAPVAISGDPVLDAALARQSESAQPLPPMSDAERFALGQTRPGEVFRPIEAQPADEATASATASEEDLAGIGKALTAPFRAARYIVRGDYMNPPPPTPSPEDPRGGTISAAQTAVPAPPPGGGGSPAQQTIAQTVSGAVPPRSAAPPQRPSAPRQPGYDPLRAIADSPGQVQAAMDQATRVAQEAGDLKAQVLQREADARDRIVADHEQRVKSFQQRGDALFNAIASQKIDPNRYWKDAAGNEDTGKRITAAIGILLSGFGSGLQGGRTPNMALAVIDKAIDRDVEAQKIDLQNKHNLFSMNMQMLGDERAATQVTLGQLKDATAGKIALVTAKMQGAEQQALGAQVVAKYRADAAGHYMQAAAFQTQQQLHKAELALIPGKQALQGLEMVQKGQQVQAGAIQLQDLQDQQKRKRDLLANPNAKQADLYRAMGYPESQIIERPGGRAALAKGDKAEDWKPIREGLSFVQEARANLDKLEELQQKGSSLSLNDRATADVVRAALIGALRLPITGPGAMSEQEREMLEAIIANPTAIWSLSSANKAKLRALRKVLEAKEGSILSNYTVGGGSLSPVTATRVAP